MGTPPEATAKSEMRAAEDDRHVQDKELWGDLKELEGAVEGLGRTSFLNFWDTAYFLVRAYDLERKIAGREPHFQKEIFRRQFKKHIDKGLVLKRTADVMLLIGLLSVSTAGYFMAGALARLLVQQGLIQINPRTLAGWGGAVSSVLFAAYARLIPTAVEMLALRREAKNPPPAAKSEMRSGVYAPLRPKKVAVEPAAKRVPAEGVSAPEKQTESFVPIREMKLPADPLAAFNHPAQTAHAALINFNDLVKFTAEEIREAAIVVSRRPEVRFVIYNEDPAHAQLLHFKQLFSFRNVDWTRSGGEAAYQALGPQLKEGGVVGFSRTAQEEDGGFSAASRQKIRRFKLSAQKPGTMTVALTFNAEDPSYRWGILREGNFYVVADALASIAVNFLDQFVFATAA